MIFIFLMMLTTFAIAGSAAFFSIYGLAHIFAGAFWPVVVMASSLEVGKLMAASFVYRYRSILSYTMKGYLVTAIIILMAITSGGIFGFLSAAYQQDMLPLEEKKLKLQSLNTEQADLKSRLTQIDNDVTRVGSDYVRARVNLMKTYDAERKRIDLRLVEITKELRTVSTDVIQTEAHTGPIIFIAKAMGRSTDDATKWMIFMIIFAFDPLAVMLTIGVNIALAHHKGEKEKLKQIPKIEEVPVIQPAVEQPITQSAPMDETQMLAHLLEEMAKRSLSPEEQLQKQMLEQIVARKSITQELRKSST